VKIIKTRGKENKKKILNVQEINSYRNIVKSISTLIKEGVIKKRKEKCFLLDKNNNGDKIK